MRFDFEELDEKLFHEFKSLDEFLQAELDFISKKIRQLKEDIVATEKIKFGPTDLIDNMLHQIKDCTTEASYERFIWNCKKELEFQEELLEHRQQSFKMRKSRVES